MLVKDPSLIIEYLKKFPLNEHDLSVLNDLDDNQKKTLEVAEKIDDTYIKKRIIQKEIEKFIEFKKVIELKFLAKFNPVVAFLIKYRFMNREIIDLFPNYSFLTDSYIKEKLISTQTFPPNNYKASDFSDLSINLFEIPYITLREATISYLQMRATPNINQQKLGNFVLSMFNQYNFIPYHNFTHGVCVMQLFANLIDISEKFRNLLTLEDQFLYLIVCLCHDNSHPGQNNHYFVKKKSDLAYSFYNKSVLENHHIVQMFKLLSQDKFNVFEHQNEEEFKITKKKIIKGILNTDMAYHFQLLEFLKKQNWQQPGEENMEDFMGSIIHAMDIGNPLLKFYNYHEQATLVSQEFHDQTIMEKLHGLDVTGFFVHKDQDGFLNSQIGFIGTFVLPLFKMISDNYDVDYEKRIEANLEQVKQLIKEKELIPNRLS